MPPSITSLTVMENWTLASLNSNLILWGVASLGLILIMMCLKDIGSRDALLPPGPPTLPLIGNIHQLPRTKLHIKFTEWAKAYGGIYSIKIGPQTAVVVTSPRIVRDLIDKRSGSSPDRPANHLTELISNGMNIAMAGYGKKWRSMRRIVHEVLTRKACVYHLPIQQAEATQVMYDFLTQPQNFYADLKRFSFSVMTSLLFGSRCPRSDDRVVKEFFKMLELLQKTLQPGAHPPIDLIPILKHTPERWAPWKTMCREVRQIQRGLYFSLISGCEKRILNGTHNGCFIEEVIEKMEKFEIDRELLAYLGGALLEGGSETTSLFLQSLVMVLVAFPDIQRKARIEIDQVIGSKRVPTLEDIDDLPYVKAIVKELHRFQPVAPLGFPHAMVNDEEIDGYVIPKGSTVFMNIWGLYHDENAFEEPEKFVPERFIVSRYGTKQTADDTGRRDDLGFGGGRRICPGIHFAHNSIYLNTMNLLWGFKFAPAIDPSTNSPIKVDPNDIIKGLLVGPSPFRCDIKVRSDGHAQLIKSAHKNARTTFAAYEHSVLL